ncbi:MAG: acyl-ACP--UDP-N-acetylglucosamine O-acyltransferase [Ignavibacteriales bacterium]|nr:acyl-ACP--UDP-N-acetylglucosamine O-acyltransferase [Ignavibacteriales bacterium]
MSATIHPNAIVSSKAQLGENVTIGPFSVVEDDVIILDNTMLQSNNYVANGTRIGKNCRLFHGAVVGMEPQDLKYSGEKTGTEVGDYTTIREYVTIHRGTDAHYKTIVGRHCFIMAYVHIAHDCVVGNHVILANAVNMAGHVTIEDHAIVGGMSPIHQFVRIGRHSMVGGGFRVSKDVPPYVLAGQEPLSFQGLNIVGLRRRNFSAETIEGLEKMYHTLYQSKLNVSQAVEAIRKEEHLTSEIRHVLDFIKASSRGIIPFRS